MKNLYTFLQGKLVPLQNMSGDIAMDKLICSEFQGEVTRMAASTQQLICNYGFAWDTLAKAGYLTFKPYAAFMVEATKLKLWKQAQEFCFQNDIPLQRIAGGDLYSLDNELLKNHVKLAEEVGMYGDGMLFVSGNQVLRFSGCSNKLALLKLQSIDECSFPFGIFELSNSYRYEKEGEIEYLTRNRKFHLPELHIVNKNLGEGLNLLLKGHAYIDHAMKEHGLSYIMLFSTTQRFVAENGWFFERLCEECAHPPVFNITEGDTCENGIVFDVEYKACMQNGALLEIATLQIDEGNTGFAYGIKSKGRPVVTIHAVFFASSVERTIYTYLDGVAQPQSRGVLPAWLAPIHCRLLPENSEFIECAERYIEKLRTLYRVELDDRILPFSDKLRDALDLKIPHIIRVGDKLSLYDEKESDFKEIELEELLSGIQDESFSLGQFSPIKLSQRIL